MQLGNTGNRDVSATLDPSLLPLAAGSALLLRDATRVTARISIQCVATPAQTYRILPLPSGFTLDALPAPWQVCAPVYNGSPVTLGLMGFDLNGQHANIRSMNTAASNFSSDYVNCNLRFDTADPWPSVLPGTAI